MLQRLFSSLGFSDSPAVPEVAVDCVSPFLSDLSVVAPDVGMGSYSFMLPDGGCRGWVQFIIDSPRQVTIHRIWTLKPGGGHGKFMLGTLCELADRHDVVLKLKVLPIGRKPYPLSREQLHQWYLRFGFEGTFKKMIRLPAEQSATFAAAGRLLDQSVGMTSMEISPGDPDKPRHEAA